MIRSLVRQERKRRKEQTASPALDENNDEDILESMEKRVKLNTEKSSKGILKKSTQPPKSSPKYVGFNDNENVVHTFEVDSPMPSWRIIEEDIDDETPGLDSTLPPPLSAPGKEDSTDNKEDKYKAFLDCLEGLDLEPPAEDVLQVYEKEIMQEIQIADRVTQEVKTHLDALKADSGEQIAEASPHKTDMNDEPASTALLSDDDDETLEDAYWRQRIL